MRQSASRNTCASNCRKALLSGLGGVIFKRGRLCKKPPLKSVSFHSFLAETRKEQFPLLLTPAEDGTSAPAAEQLRHITQTHIGAGIAPHFKATEIARLLTIGCTAMLNLIQHLLIFIIVRVHADRPADMLQSRHLIAHAIVGQSAEIVPPGIALGAGIQGVQGLLVPAEANVLVSRLLILIAGLAVLLTVTAEGIIAAVAIILTLIKLINKISNASAKVDILH